MIDSNNPPQRTILAAVLGGISILVLLLLLLKGGHHLLFKAETPPELVVSTGTFKPGDTLSILLTEKNVSSADAGKIYSALTKVFDTRRIKPGQTFEITKTTDN